MSTNAATLDLSRPIFGLDLSHHQQPLGPAAAAEAYKHGVRFAWIKATEGADHTDKRTAVHLEQLSAAGVSCGLYHYARPDFRKDPAPEVAHFCAALERYSRQGTKLRPVIDIEEPGSAKEKLSHAVEYLAAFVDGVRQKTGVTPVVYTGFYWWLRHLGGAPWGETFEGAPIWMARHVRGQEPQTLGKFTTALQTSTAKALPLPTGAALAAWQFTAHGQLPGYGQRLDLNVSDAAHLTRAVWPGSVVADIEGVSKDNSTLLAMAGAAAALAAAAG